MKIGTKVYTTRDVMITGTDNWIPAGTVGTVINVTEEDLIAMNGGVVYIDATLVIDFDNGATVQTDVDIDMDAIDIYDDHADQQMAVSRMYMKRMF